MSMSAYDLYRIHRLAEAVENKTRIARAYDPFSKTIEGAKEIVSFVTTDTSPETGKRGYTIRHLVVDKDDNPVFHVMSGVGIGEIPSSRTVKKLFASFQQDSTAFYLDSRGEPRIRTVKEQPLPYESQSKPAQAKLRTPGPYPPSLECTDEVTWTGPGPQNATNKKGYPNPGAAEWSEREGMFQLEYALKEWNARHPGGPHYEALPEDLGTPRKRTLEECYETGFTWVDEGSDIGAMESLMKENGHPFDEQNLMRIYNSSERENYR